MNSEDRFAKDLPLGPILFDILSVSLFALIFAGIPEFGFEPYQRGFFCDDQSIRLPYKPDTVTPVFLLLILTFTLFITVGGVEFYLRFTGAGIEDTVYAIKGRRLSGFLIRFCTYAGYCFFGLTINLVICNITKYFVGRLRPHFMAVCHPNMDFSVCKDPLFYYTNYTCTFHGFSDIVVQKNVRLSFFSGHSSTTMHVAVFCAIYLYARLPRRMYGISLLPIFQTILIVIALAVGYSRISDHKHHWSDVFCGFIVGIITGVVSAVYIAQLFNRQPFLYNKERKRLLIDPAEHISRRDTITADPLTAQQTSSTVHGVHFSSSGGTVPYRREVHDSRRGELDAVVIS